MSNLETYRTISIRRVSKPHI